MANHSPQHRHLYRIRNNERPGAIQHYIQYAINKYTNAVSLLVASNYYAAHSSVHAYVIEPSPSFRFSEERDDKRSEVRVS